MKTLRYFAAVIAAATVMNVNAQETASVESFDFTAIADNGDTATIDMSYIDLADAFGGKPYDVKFKDGEPKATVITGWSVGVKGGINSYMGAQYGAFIQDYFGWGHIALNAEISEKLRLQPRSPNAYPILSRIPNGRTSFLMSNPVASIVITSPFFSFRRCRSPIF